MAEASDMCRGHLRILVCSRALPILYVGHSG